MPPSHDPSYPLFPILSFLGFILTSIPLPWHLQAWNSGTCAFMLWTGLGCLNLFVNSLIWKGNVANVAPRWCDISSKIYIGVSIGIPASVLCINRRLYSLLAVQSTFITKSDKRRMAMIDVCIALGWPIIIMALHYVVQGHRFDILEDVGCYPFVYNVTLAYPLYYIWPPLIGAISFVYSAFTLRSFWIRRVQFSQLIACTSGMTISRYLRLMALASFDMVFHVPLGIFVIVIGNTGSGPAPWISWEDTHFNFSRVGIQPASLWRSELLSQMAVELTRWLPIFCALLFFSLFGFAEEARGQYQKIFLEAARLFGYRHRPAPRHVPNHQFPSFVKQSKDRSNSSDGTTLASGPPTPHKSKHFTESATASRPGVDFRVHLPPDLERGGKFMHSISSRFSDHPTFSFSSSTYAPFSPISSTETILGSMAPRPNLVNHHPHSPLFLEPAIGVHSDMRSSSHILPSFERHQALHEMFSSDPIDTPRGALLKSMR